MTGAIRKRPLLLGHRGARACKTIPENTLASFDRALADGCDGFEFDVRLTSDGEAVLCHDPRSRGIEIAHTSAEECALPRVREVLARYHECAFLDIELKVSGLEKIIISALQENSPSRGFVVSSFLPEVLESLHAQSAAIPLGLICESRDEFLRWAHMPVEYVIPHYKLLDSILIKDLKQAGKRILVWTVNSGSDMQRFADLGVDGIISDDTRRLAGTLG